MIVGSAGVDQKVAEGETVSLEGTGNADTFSWVQLSGATSLDLDAAIAGMKDLVTRNLVPAPVEPA